MTEQRTAAEIRAYLAHNEDTDMPLHEYVAILEEDAGRLLDAAQTGWALLAQMMRGGYAVSTEGMLWVRENESWLAESPEATETPAEQVRRHINELAAWVAADSPEEEADEDA